MYFLNFLLLHFLVICVIRGFMSFFQEPPLCVTTIHGNLKRAQEVVFLLDGIEQDCVVDVSNAVIVETSLHRDDSQARTSKNKLNDALMMIKNMEQDTADTSTVSLHQYIKNRLLAEAIHKNGRGRQHDGMPYKSDDDVAAPDQQVQTIYVTPLLETTVKLQQQQQQQQDYPQDDRIAKLESVIDNLRRNNKTVLYYYILVAGAHSQNLVLQKATQETLYQFNQQLLNLGL